MLNLVTDYKKITRAVKLLFWVFLWVIVFSSCKVNAQKTKTESRKIPIHYQEGGCRISFEKDSFDLDSIAFAKLDKKIIYVNSAVSEKCDIIIEPWSGINETKKNPAIGVLRSKAIIDYYEKKHAIHREHFLIRDINHFDDADWSHHPDRNDPFVYFGAQNCAPNREE